jgi:hypothetical protein
MSDPQPLLCRPLSRAEAPALHAVLGFRCAPPQALRCRLLRRLDARLSVTVPRHMVIRPSLPLRCKLIAA